jgi:hypothetical protein
MPYNGLVEREPSLLSDLALETSRSLKAMSPPAKGALILGLIGWIVVQFALPQDARLRRP